MDADALTLIYRRNEFYRNKYHLVLAVCGLCLVMIVMLIGMLVYVVKRPPSPLYFVTDKAGRFIQDIPVQQPNMSTPEVAEWAVEAVEAAYSYDFVNYHYQLQAAQKYFTDYGWREYMKGLDQSNNLVALKERRQIVLAKVVSPPKLLGEGPMANQAKNYAWQFEMPVLVTYMTPPYDDVSGKSKNENALDITVLIMRESVLTSYKGLGVVQLIGTFATAAPQTQTLTAPS
jgi:intracellular multiplication protein IcmL